MSSNIEPLVPKLRFPEFDGKPGWEESKLGSVSEIVRGGSPRPIEDFTTSDPTGLSWLKIGDVDPESKYITHTREKVIKEALSKTRVVEPGDLILSNSMSFGRPYISQITTCIHDGWIAIRKIRSNILANFLYYSISSEPSQRYFEDNAAGAAVRNLNADIIKLLPIGITTKEEQQKIAACLSSLDDLITAETEKLEALRAHKKGLMQQLFPAEGETVPRLRFEGFEGEWAESILNDFLDLLTDFEANGSFADVKKNVTIYDDRNYAWYVRATDLENNSDLGKVKFVDKHSYEYLRKTTLFGGELLIAKRGEIGKIFFFEQKENLPATVAPNLYLLKMNKKAVPKFFYYFFTSSLGNESLKRLNASSTIGALYKDDVKSIKLLVPPIEEQNTIALCLSSVDETITVQLETIELLKSHKKSLLQNLFPSPTE
ncbi:MAG: restriction endonuclease subunit S [Proteobacteria bacterium]|nr:MAG: restriction endonuclease subunit S [Pseudomonadota bacterium]